jgi:sortase A
VSEVPGVPPEAEQVLRRRREIPPPETSPREATAAEVLGDAGLPRRSVLGAATQITPPMEEDLNPPAPSGPGAGFDAGALPPPAWAAIPAGPGAATAAVPEPAGLDATASLPPIWEPAGEQDQPMGPMAWRAVPGATAAPAPAGGRRAAPPGTPRARRKRGPVATVVGVVGELLITLGLLMGLYVAWQLVWTNVEAKAEAKQQIAQITEQPEWVAPPPAPKPGEPVVYAPKHTEAPPVDDLKPPAEGTPIAVLHVPSWGYDWSFPIAHGVDKPSVLDAGFIGHYPETVLPGQVGNFATAGHSGVYGGPYDHENELVENDLAIVETDKYYLVYRLSNSLYGEDSTPRAVNPDQTWTITPNPFAKPDPFNPSEPPTKRLMTMTTCYPIYTSRQRWIAWFELVYWTDKTEGPLEDLVPPDQRNG